MYIRICIICGYLTMICCNRFLKKFIDFHCHMNQVIQTIKQTRKIENCRKKSEAYFNNIKKPKSQICRPQSNQCLNEINDFRYHKDDQNDFNIGLEIQKISNTDSVTPCLNGKSLVNDLKYVAKICETESDPEKIKKFAKTLKLLHPNIIYPYITAVCLKDDVSLLTEIESTPINIEEIPPFFALADEISDLATNQNDFHIYLKMIANKSKDPLIQTPNFITNYKNDVIKPLPSELKQKYNFIQKVKQFNPKEIPKLEESNYLSNQKINGNKNFD